MDNNGGDQQGGGDWGLREEGLTGILQGRGEGEIKGMGRVPRADRLCCCCAAQHQFDE